VDLGQILVILLSIVLGSWLVAGIGYNRRRAANIGRWLEPGFKIFGGRPGASWTGGSGRGMRMSLRDTRAPFRRVELIVRLMPRENFPLWLFERLRGRGDEFALRGWLRNPIRGELEAVPMSSHMAGALRTHTETPWQCEEISSRWLLARRGDVSETQVAALRAFITSHDRQFQRFSLRRTEPNLFVQMSLDGLTGQPSRELLSWIKELVD
jgi:hypothetical protein